MSIWSLIYLLLWNYVLKAYEYLVFDLSTVMELCIEIIQCLFFMVINFHENFKGEYGTKRWRVRELGGSSCMEDQTAKTLFKSWSLTSLTSDLFRQRYIYIYKLRCEGKGVPATSTTGETCRRAKGRLRRW
jgi:hypothetical protein